MSVTDEHLRVVEQVLDGAALWGAELETRYRVLACTFEPTAGRHPDPDASDRRLQVLFSPVHTVLGVLRRRDEQGRTVIERFDVGLLVDVVDSFDGASVTGEFFDQGEPADDEWKPAGADWSVEGRAQTLDGRSHDVRLGLQGEGERSFDLYATFDDVQIRTPDGEELDLASL